jgi:hypothetical protein
LQSKNEKVSEKMFNTIPIYKINGDVINQFNLECKDWENELNEHTKNHKVLINNEENEKNEEKPEEEKPEEEKPEEKPKENEEEPEEEKAEENEEPENNYDLEDEELNNALKEENNRNDGNGNDDNEDEEDYGVSGGNSKKIYGGYNNIKKNKAKYRIIKHNF